ncbi:MAG: GNAT family N-acetyltransferase [Erythrobacter sp.]|nr:MAG: GNAT family N-acetyltransferase [Erythrobacter sp.]
MEFEIDRLKAEDLKAAIAIQREIYPEKLIESEPVFSSRIGLEGSYCLSAKSDDVLLGYLIAHAWIANSPPALGAVLADPAPKEILYVHDLAVSHHGRGRGVGRKLINRAMATAADEGVAEAQLIAVRGAGSFWEQLGFEKIVASSNLKKKLQSYGSDSVWMTRPLG